MDDLDYEERDYGEMVLAEAEESAEIIEREEMLDKRIDEVTEQSYAKGKASAQAEIDALVTALDMMKDKYMAVQYPMMWLHDVVKIDPEVEQADRLTNKHKHKGLRAKGNTVLVPADKLAKMKTEIDSHKKVIKSQGKAINAYCKKIGELNEDTERMIAEKVEMQTEIDELVDMLEELLQEYNVTYSPDELNMMDALIARHRGDEMEKYTASEVYNSMGYRDAQVVLADEAQDEIDELVEMLELIVDPERVWSEKEVKELIAKHKGR